MTPTEKAENALNARISRIQTSLGETKSEAAQRLLFQSLVVCIGVGESLTDYVKAIGQYAQARHGALKQEHTTLTAEHAELLKSGKEMLERLKADPRDHAVRKEIDAAQQSMAAIQKNLRRGANALQRDVAPSIAMIDELALTIRKLAEAEQLDALKRATKMAVENARELYHVHPTLPAKNMIDAASWEKSALSEIDQATDFQEAYSRAGYQVMIALEVMTIAVSSAPPQTAEEIISRANEAVGTRLKTITARFTKAL